jgi:hypothetical protein
MRDFGGLVCFFSILNCVAGDHNWHDMLIWLVAGAVVYVCGCLGQAVDKMKGSS